ncbi:MAG TPA: phosphodiester glycosidase family protein [Candidatus Polarisedimenticolia bacterium]|jgi:hypothetical protein|nr:phosphodiester glycosidase family protein [Candidatus Polarisedimenticolia bacterium]
MRRKHTSLASALAIAIACAAAAPPAKEAPSPFQRLEPGLELGEFLSDKAAGGDRVIHVVRLDPKRYRLRLLNASAFPQAAALTARQWAERNHLAAAINASMYQADLRSSVALMQTRGHVNNPHLSKDKAVLAFDPVDPSMPPVQIIDRECQDFEALRGAYGSLVQNIRMVSCDGRNVWAAQPYAWSVAAVGMDRQGRVLLLQTRAPHTTHDFIEALLALPLDLKNAMYVEGGREAQLFVRGGGRDYEFTGTSDESDPGHAPGPAWPIPNVIGAEPIAAASSPPAAPDQRPRR